MPDNLHEMTAAELGEALRQMQSQGMTLVEVHTNADDKAAQGLLLKLGLTPADRGTVLVKELM